MHVWHTVKCYMGDVLERAGLQYVSSEKQSTLTSSLSDFQGFFLSPELSDHDKCECRRRSSV